MEHKNNCLLCGKELEYREVSTDLKCEYCGQTFRSNVTCADGHYVCDGCHGLSANEVILRYCVGTDSTDPLDMALDLMRHPKVKMHGPEHHFLVPAVLLAAYYNIKGEKGKKASKMEEARTRAKNVLGGFCGYYGNCGAAVGVGIFFSIITGTTPLSEGTWAMANLATAKALLSIAEHGGPRCCKRTSFLAIISAARSLKEHFDLDLGTRSKVVCEFSSLNKECKGKDCPFQKGHARAE